MLIRVIMTEILERLQQVDEAALHFFDPARVLRKRRRQIVEHALLELGVVYNDRARIANAVAQPVQELSPWISATVGEEGVMLQRHARHGLPVQAELKGHLLIWTQ